MDKFKQAYFAHDLAKKFQIFTAVHNSMFRFSSEDTLSNLRAELRDYCLPKQVVVILFTIKHARKLLNNIKTSILHYKPFFEVRISGFHMVHYIKAVTDNVEFYISR